MLPENMARLVFKDLPFLIPLPTATDDLETAARKMDAIANIITQGGRLELNVWPDSIILRHDSEGFGKQSMNTTELLAFDAWQYGNVPVPAFDWTCTMPVTEDSRKTCQDRAAAMDIIWQHRGATPGNAAWLSTKMSAVLPLVKAVEKVMRAQEYLALHDPFKGLDENQIAEAETLRFIIRAAGDSVKQDKAKVSRVTYSISQSQAVLKDRLAAIVDG